MGQRRMVEKNSMRLEAMHLFFYQVKKMKKYCAGRRVLWVALVYLQNSKFNLDPLSG